MKSYALSCEVTTSERLTLDYIKYADRLKHRFPKSYKNPNPRKCKVDRRAIVDRLLEYNKKIDAPKPVIQNIQALLQPETYAVITGQQPGLFSGPLYTIYKAVSTLIICERLSSRKQLLVPIFWNASEDHDLPEIDHITMFRRNEPFRIRYDSVLKDVALSHMSLDKPELNKMLATVKEISPSTEFKAPLLKEAEGIIEKSSTIGDFFSRFMIHLFGEWGLVMVEPHYFRDLMIPIFDKLIRCPTKCTQLLEEAGSKLKELGYPPRIHKKSGICNFFLLDEDGKRLQVTHNREFHAGSTAYSQGELLNLLHESPHRFSANALTRPITQDLLFPTFAYVAGPSEIAYQAQLKEIYDFFSIEMPVIFPRFGATIIEKKVSKVIRKYGLEVHELKSPERLLKKMAREKIDGVFNSLKIDISRSLAEVTRKAESIDESLAASCSLAKGRIIKTIEGLEDKIASKLKEQNLASRRQITKAHINVFPYGHLQEREVNVLEYLIKFGKEFLRVAYRSFLEADYGEHRVIKC
ncbi:MAG: bacillithiol biosynthesis cysteine-adding enzyme BshC [Candidatus Bathyarchaeota archaeon]|nr:MAG: bacillithiol biosynthesis cysteine-adding enzyme BshC [Candidatus Bathyarchaeota archaeon]